MNEFSYKKSGVDIEKADKLISNIKGLAQSTYTKGVIGGIGSFASLFEIDVNAYPNPILVSGTDGVGTKLEIAIRQNNFSGIGQDLVAMCVNDIITIGAKPLFFLDYFATGKLDLEQSSQVIHSIALACKKIDCALVGGETAEMPGFYKDGDFDIAGFAVGIVNKNKIIDGKKVKNGDIVVGLPSSGLHSNGYSLARKIVREKFKNDLNYNIDSESLGDLLLKPTKLYTNEILALLEKVNIKAIAHITGGGLIENIPRVLPKDLSVKLSLPKLPKIFKVLKDAASVSSNEMFKTFNCGIGMILILDKNDVDKVINSTHSYVVGEITNNNDQKVSIESAL